MIIKERPSRRTLKQQFQMELMLILPDEETLETDPLTPEEYLDHLEYENWLDRQADEAAAEEAAAEMYYNDSSFWENWDDLDDWDDDDYDDGWYTWDDYDWDEPNEELED